MKRFLSDLRELSFYLPQVCVIYYHTWERAQSVEALQTLKAAK